METTNYAHKDLSEGIRSLPDRSADYTEWADSALKAEERNDWEEAQALWEYALIDSVKDCNPNGKDEEDIKKNGTGFVILAHLTNLMDAHLNQNWDKKEKTGPAGYWKAFYSHRKHVMKNTSSIGSNMVCILIALVLAFGFYFVKPPFEGVSYYVLLGAVIVVCGALAFVAWGITDSIIAVLITFFGGLKLLDYLSKKVSDYFNLGSDNLAMLYMLRTLGGVIGGIMFIMALKSIYDKNSANDPIREAKREIGEDAPNYFRHAKACATALNCILSPVESDLELNTLAVHRYKIAYPQCDMWDFKEISEYTEGILVTDQIMDAGQVILRARVLRDYYAEMARDA